MGCLTTRPISSDGPVALEPNEGILVLHVETNVAIRNLHTQRLRVVGNLEPGSHLQLLAITAGEYVWTRLRLTNSFRFRLEELDGMAFSVLPGRISYPGLLVVDAKLGGWKGLTARVINRSGMVSHDFPARSDRVKLV